MHVTNKSLVRAISLLDFLTGGARTLSQLSEQIGIMPSGTLKVLWTFMEASMVCQLDDGRCALASGCCRFARGYMAQNPLACLALPEVRKLSQQSGMHAVLAVFRNNQQVNLLYVDEAVGFAETLPSSVGAAWMQATGQVLLAYLSKEVVEAHLAQYPLVRTRIEEHLLTDFRYGLQMIRQKGYAFVKAPYMGTLAAAAPIRDYTGEVVAALGQPLPHARNKTARIKAIRESADRISGLVGYKR